MRYAWYNLSQYIRPIDKIFNKIMIRLFSLIRVYIATVIRCLLSSGAIEL